MSGFTAGDCERAADHLATAEITNLINTLRDGEKTAIVKIARLYARKTSYGHEDLLQESYCRVLDGRRGWLRGVPAVPFFHGVMRSIAWEWKREFTSQEIDIGDEGAVERGTLAKIDMMKILALFDDDPAARKIVLEMMDGARGEELQESSGLNPTEYESKRRKIRRRIEKLG
jgi:RNA polymerase sigma-70 factor (ECF subfamily)